MRRGLNTIFAAVPTTSKLNNQLTGVGQLRAILKEGNFTGLALCESKGFTQEQQASKVNCAGAPVHGDTENCTH
jgi:hypothetical protein